MHSQYINKLTVKQNKEILDSKEKKYPVMTIKIPSNSNVNNFEGEITNENHQKEEADDFNLTDHLIPAYFTKEKAVEIFTRANVMIIKDKEEDNKNSRLLAADVDILDYSMKDNLDDPSKKHSGNLSPNTKDINNKNNLQKSSSNFHNDSNKNKTGSLYIMFTSNIFDINWVIYYLDKREETGIFDTLINIMQTKYVDESIFYLPQLCTILVYKNNTESLEDYILDRCVNQMKFSLRIYWLIGSYLENAANEKIAKIYRSILHKLEETLVNGRRCTMSNYVKYNNQLLMGSMAIYTQSIDKELRLKYFDVCVDFYKQLKEMCEKLKSFPREKEFKNNRNVILKDFIFMFNTNLQNIRYEHKNSQCDSNAHNSNVNNFYNGIILPFDDCASTMDEYNSLIVRIIPNYSFCFSTKARVPVKLCVECVKVSECERWNELIVEVEENEKNIPHIKKSNETVTEAVALQLKNKINPIDILNFIEDLSLTESINLNRLDEKNKIKIEDATTNEKTPKNNFRKSLDEYMLEVQLKNEPIITNKSCFESKNESAEENNVISDDCIQISNDLNFNDNANSCSRENPNLIIDSYNSNNLSNSVKEDKMDDDFVMVEYNPKMLDVFGKKWADIQKEIKENSPYRKFSTYTIKNFMAKADDDLRQELMTMQLIKKFVEIFQKSEINLKIRAYEILITSSTSGLIEFIPNTNSIDGIKKKIPHNWNLHTFYKNFFLDSFEEAQKNFAESLAAYSLICYYLQIKDRHNGNILIDMNGHIIHIDFGFILGISPGNLNFENAPFKMTEEYMEILDGIDSPMFQYYKSLMLRGMLELRKHVDVFLKIIEIMSKGAKMPCFENVEVNVVIQKFKERFFEKRSENDFTKIVDDLIYASYNNFWTGKYDSYQKLTNGILP